MMDMMKMNNEPTKEEAELLQAAAEGKPEHRTRRLLVSFGGTICTAPTQNGRIAMHTRDMWANCEPIGTDECGAEDILAVACVMVANVAKEAGDEEKKIFMNALKDLVFGDEKTRETLVGFMISGAFISSSGVAYKVNIRKADK